MDASRARRESGELLGWDLPPVALLPLRDAERETRGLRLLPGKTRLQGLLRRDPAQAACSWGASPSPLLQPCGCADSKPPFSPPRRTARGAIEAAASAAVSRTWRSLPMVPTRSDSPTKPQKRQREVNFVLINIKFHEIKSFDER